MTLWDPRDPGRSCYTCGRPPDGRFPDGSPSYRCSHPPVEASAAELARWAELALAHPEVVLGPDARAEVEAHIAEVAATVRRNGYGDRFKPNRSQRSIDLDGYGAEKAVALHLDLPWNKVILDGPVRRKPADVGRNVEVRTWPNESYCPVRDGDDPRFLVVLAVGHFPRFRLVAWGRIGDLMRPEWRYDDERKHPFWRVPTGAMNPFPLTARVR